jgi:hypothetical protein
MKLLRTQMREAIVKKLSVLENMTVFDSPLYPLALQDLPALTVTAEKEIQVPDSGVLGKDGACIYSYMLPIIVEGILQNTDDLHAACEAIALSVMEALQSDMTLGGLCKALYWESGAEMITSNEGETPIGKVRLSATLLYRAAENALYQSCD